MKYCGNVDVDPQVLEKYGRDLLDKKSLRKKAYKVHLRLEKPIDEFDSSDKELDSDSDYGDDSEDLFRLTKD